VIVFAGAAQFVWHVPWQMSAYEYVEPRRGDAADPDARPRTAHDRLRAVGDRSCRRCGATRCARALHTGIAIASLQPVRHSQPSGGRSMARRRPSYLAVAKTDYPPYLRRLALHRVRRGRVAYGGAR